MVPPPKKLGICGAVTFAMSIIIGFITMPMVIKSQIKSQMALKPNSDVRGLWEKFPLPLDFKIYLFNVTNPKEIAEGAKPVVQEIGPFFYDEYKEKIELEDRDEDDTVAYKQRWSFFFNPSKSNGLTGEEEIVFPHLLILGMVLTTLKEKPTMMTVVGKAVDSIFKKPDSIFVKVKAKDILFDGLPIDCTVTDFAGNAVCTILKQEAKDLIPDGENRYRLAVFGHKNGTIIHERIRVIRGIKNIQDVGKVVEYNEKPELETWAGEPCNTFNGTDQTIFPPFLYEDQDLVSFTPDVCRSFSATFQKKLKVKGLNVNRYSGGLGDMSTDPNLKCFCPTEDTCLPQGMFDISKCVGAPIIATLPHFFDTDGRYLKTVDGLHPDKDKHELLVDFEPVTGSPIQAAKRLQFNMFIKPVPKFKLMKNFPNALLPLLWLEEGILLDDEFVKQIKMVFILKKVVSGVKWTLFIVGMGLGGAAGFMEYKRRQGEKKVEITKVSPQGSANAVNGEKKWPNNINNMQPATVPATLD